MPSEQEFSTENQNQEAGDAARTGAIPLNDLPPVLRNWQVIEIDGEATRVDPEPDKSDEQPAKSATVISDHPDDLLVASLESRALTIDAGDTATFQLSLLNNGDRTALFQVSVEGWIHEQWLTSSSRESATRATSTRDFASILNKRCAVSITMLSVRIPKKSVRSVRSRGGGLMSTV